MSRILLGAAGWLLLADLAAAQPFDLAPFARPCCSRDADSRPTRFDYGHPAGPVRRDDGSWVYGLAWAEERDISEVLVRFGAASDPRRVAIEYWHKYWPPPPPHMPAMEDPVDDPWQGKWIAPAAVSSCEGLECRFRFPPLQAGENPNASNLPGVTYRRTLKLRLRFAAGNRPAIERVSVFNGSTVRRLTLQARFDQGPATPAVFSAYNGRILGTRAEAGTTRLTIETVTPGLAGSNDQTIVRVSRGEAVFSFLPTDAERGPIHVPDFHAWITTVSGSAPLAGPARLRIRERLAAEPEQSYERARREIPPLDPVKRQGDRLYLPLSAEASWQKFAVEWGGNVFVSKRLTKAKGRQLARLEWPGDRLRWRIGTGTGPGFREAAGDSELRQLEDSLPVAIAQWTSDGLEYEQESFATLLSGPLSPEDPQRSEDTPAVLMMRIRVRNPAGGAATASLSLGTEPAEGLRFENGLLANEDGLVRALVRVPAGATSRAGFALHVALPVAGRGVSAILLAIPFVPRLSGPERARLLALDFDAERRRVVGYWRAATDGVVPFRVPESVFNTFARGLVARIRMSVTKDPSSGLYMVPAASYGYPVFANEAAFQSQLLDVLGQHELSAKYLRTLVELQGSKAMPGTFDGDQKAVYHGARVNSDYDYTAHGYNLDHGTVLWTLAEHYFFTRDRAWLASVAGGMKRAADWIVEQRRRTMVAGAEEYGLLPAGQLEDNTDWGHWFAVNAYASVGLSGLAAALADTGDPDAPRYRSAAEAYLADVRKAALRAAAEAPVIRLRDNTFVPWVPTRSGQRIRLFGPLRTGFYSRYPERLNPTFRLSATREVLYGPLILLDTGLFDSAEPLARWVLDDWEDNATMSEPLGLHVHGWVDEEQWFSRGGMVFQANLQNPIRAYLRRGEARAAIRGLYNNFVSCHYPSVNVFTEEYREWRFPSGPFFKIPDEAKFVHRLRDLLVTEQGDELWLAAAAPARWFAPGRQIAVTAAPTRFGPVSYTVTASENEVAARIALPRRNPFRTAWLSVRLPDGRALGEVTLDGRPWPKFDRATGRIELPQTGRELILRVRTQRP